MSSPHHHVDVISRGKNQSALTAAAYRHATKMMNRAGEATKDFSSKLPELTHAEIAVPANAPAWAVNAFGPSAFQQTYADLLYDHHLHDDNFTKTELELNTWAELSERLWQSVDTGEDTFNKFKNRAQMARSITLALPAMLSRECHIELVQGYVKEAFTSHGMVADWVLHDTGKGNPHAHIMVTLRRLNDLSWDQYKAREWNSVSVLREQRATWTKHANIMLEREGFDERIDHRTLAAQQEELGVEPKIKPENWNLQYTPQADAKGDVQRDRERYEETRRKNQQMLRDDPEHILTMVQIDRATFGRTHVEAAFAKRLDLSLENDKDELADLTDRAMSSDRLLPVIGKDGPEKIYITVGKAGLIQQVAIDAARLQGSQLEDTWAADEKIIRIGKGQTVNLNHSTPLDGTQVGKNEKDGSTASVSHATKGPIPDGLEMGSGPIHVDVVAYTHADTWVNSTPTSENLSAMSSTSHTPDIVAQSRYARPSAAVVRAALDAQAENLFRLAFGAPVRKSGTEWRAKDNMAIAMQVHGAKRGLWRDHSAGLGGDLFDLIATHFLGLESARQDFPRVMEHAIQFCGMSRGELQPTKQAMEQLERRRIQRERNAREEEKQERRRRDALVKDVQALATELNTSDDVAQIGSSHVPACSAATYLKSRGIQTVPATGLSWMTGQGQQTFPRGLIGSDDDALIVWAYNEKGMITGGQRILVNPDGTKPDRDVRKPSFGQISGSVARFPAVSVERAHTPLVIAEGPESALSIWQATGYETWAVFGVSGWTSAPIPTDREVILAPDRDAPTSPAGCAFRKALAHHVSRGCNIKVATAPEAMGSKKDLNDTDQRAGPDAVRHALDHARDVRPWLSRDLNDGQRAAAEAMLNTERLTLVTGHAGTGKTFTLTEVARVWRDRGVEVLAGAPSGKATQALSTLDGVEVATLSAWESRWARGQVPVARSEGAGFIFIMDEAGMVGSGQWARIQSKIGAMGGKLIAIGDPEQLQPINEISGWKEAERSVRDAGGVVSVINIVQRQNDAGDRAATTALAKGDHSSIAAAIHHYADKGALSFGMLNPIESIARDFVNGVRREDGIVDFESRLAMAATNTDVDRLNQAIQAEAIKQGFVDATTMQEFPVDIINRSVDSDGMTVTTRTEQLVRVGVGDRVMLTMPYSDAHLPRSSFGTVVALRPDQITLQMDGSGEHVDIDPVAFPYFTHGYAATVHKAQGMTVDQAFVLLHGSMNRYGINVALTRHCHDVQVYGQEDHCESIEDLIQLAGRRSAPSKEIRRVADHSMVALPAPDHVLSRSDWIGRTQQQADVKMTQDRYLMSVMARVAGLLGADHADNDPLLADIDFGTTADYTREPQRVIDDLVLRQGVFFAEEVAGVLARQVRDPDTFVRLFVHAMSHQDLVYLPRASGRPGDTEARVYTTQSHLSAEIVAMDRGLALAMRSTPHLLDAQVIDVDEFAGALDQDQRHVLHTLLDGSPSPNNPSRGDLHIIEGGTGSGKTRLAARLAGALEQAPGCVIAVSPTEAGRQALMAEGVEALTLATYLSQPLSLNAHPKAPQTVILDDAHGLGVKMADIVLARIEAEGSRLIAMVNPHRRPAIAGPVFQRLGERLRDDPRQHHDPAPLPSSSRLNGHHGAHHADVQHLAACLHSECSAQEVFNGLQDAVNSGLIVAAGARNDAVIHTATSYIADRSHDKLAVAWSRADADALTVAIRTGLDISDPERRSFDSPEHGACKGLKPHDRLRFLSAGHALTADPSSQDSSRINRGDLATVVGDENGMIKLTVTGPHGDDPRDILVPNDGPLPTWCFAFASTIMASAGRRHDRVHLLANQTMDREVLAAGVAIARTHVMVGVTADDDQLYDVLNAISRRERLPRAAMDYGFNPQKTLSIAAHRAANNDMPRHDPPLLVAPSDDRDEESTAIDLAAVSSLPKIRLNDVTLKKANRMFLQDHPAHILMLLAARQGVFTEVDVRQALREKTEYRLSECDVTSMARQVLTSSELVKLSQLTPDGVPQYMTMARAEQLLQIGDAAVQLSTAHFTPGDGPVLRPKALDALNASQREAADAMLDGTRLTMVTGKAGTGKTFTLKAVASEWRARGVTVLAGAPSGKATAELRGLRGVQAHTLAMWEARWARGEVPTEPFVFIMDEAGMVGAGQWSRLQARVWALGGKLITVGDPDQLQPVSDLPGWSLAEQASGGSVVIDNVIRQQNIFDQLATGQLARGGKNIADAIAYYEASGRLKLTSEVLADPISALARDYVAAGKSMTTEEGDENNVKSRIALGYSNRDVAALNDHIRQLTKAEALRAIAAGHQNTDSERRVFDPRTERQYGTIIRTLIDHDGMPQPLTTDRLLAVGDRVIATAALTSLGIPTSSFGTVVATHDDRLDVRFDGHDEITLLHSHEWMNLDYGYAATIHKSQGLSADDVFVLAHRRMHRHALYVAMSRHRDTLSVYGRVGHATCVADLIRLGQAPGSLDMAPDDLEHLVDKTSSRRYVPALTTDDVGQRTDWMALTGHNDGSQRLSAFVGDSHAMAVAERLAGLMAARFDPAAPLVPDDVSEHDRWYLSDPTQVVDDLLQRSSVIRADDIAERLARVVTDPETFLRLFAQALAHKDVVMLSECDQNGVPVYSTKTQVNRDVRAVDLGTQLAVSAVSPTAPSADFDAIIRNDWQLKQRVDLQNTDAHRQALVWGMTPTRLRLVRGDAGSGKTHIASDLAHLHAQAGWNVVTVAPTGSGCTALKTAGVSRPMTMRRFLTLTGPASDASRTDPVLTANTVVILDDATRLAGTDVTTLLTRVDQSGAKLVAMLGGDEQQPLGAGPIMRALDMRVGSLTIGHDQVRAPWRADVLSHVLNGGAMADAAISDLRDHEALVAGTNARQAITAMAHSYITDPSTDKIALTWSRADAIAVTNAIRTALDDILPERQKRPRARHDAIKDLKVGDRLRFIAGTAWVPPRQQTPAWHAQRIMVGDHAEVMGFDARTDALRLQVTARDGQSSREVVIPARQHDTLPQWTFAFAGTIHGEGAQVRKSVHLLASPGMTRQVFAAGIAAHQEQLKVIVPSSDQRMEEVLQRIHRRNGRAESVLDYGFDVTQGARAAVQALQQGRGRDAQVGDRTAGWAAAFGRLGAIVGFRRTVTEPSPPSHVTQQVLAEVMGAVSAWETDHNCRVTAQDRIALEHYVRRVSQPRAWRKLLRQVPSRLSRAADDHARSVVGSSAGQGGNSETQAIARYLARGASAAQALGEDTVADIFERALQRFGEHMTRTRIAGRENDVKEMDDTAINQREPHSPQQALQLAVAISERIDAHHPIHQCDLVGEIATLLPQAEVLSEVDRAKVNSLCHTLARDRVIFDAKRTLARELVATDPRGPLAQSFNEDIFMAVEGPRPVNLQHPLEFQHNSVKEEYDRRVPEVVKVVAKSKLHPTAMERAAAHVIYSVEKGSGDDALGQVLRDVFKQGSLPSAKAFMQERTQLLMDIPAITKVKDEQTARAMLKRVFRSFTHREIMAFAHSTSDDGQGRAIADGLKRLTRGSRYGFAAWTPAVKQLARQLHPKRARTRSQGLEL
ncbi:MAG: AAA family ATPase [Aestuariivita sp.]|nr:AAA family ATPase [Aestuariivita sp.]